MLFINLLLITKLCLCEYLSSVEMIDVFDESNVDFESVTTVTDTLYRGAINNFGDTTFGTNAGVNTTDNVYAGTENCTEKNTITDGNLTSDNTRKWDFNTTSTDKIENMIISNYNGLTNNNLTDKNSDDILYIKPINTGDANVRTPLNNDLEFYNSDTTDKAYNNGNADRRTQPINATESVYHNRVNNNRANIMGPLHVDMFSNNNKAYNNDNENVRTHFNNVTEFVTSNDSTKIKPHNDAVDFNNNVTAYNNGKPNTSIWALNWFDNATELFENNEASHSDSGNIKRPVNDGMDFLINDAAYNNRNANRSNQANIHMNHLHNDAAYKMVNASIKEQFNNASNLSSSNNNNGYHNGNSSVMKQLYNKIELPNNYTANQNGQIYSYTWTPFTPFNSNLNGTFTSAYKQYNKSGTLPAFSIPDSPFSCPEEEPPTNIGPYEVPTQRDMILHMRNHLLAMYQGFHTKAMHFLRDIKEATQASWSRKMFCRGPTELMYYRRCVRWVGDLSILTTKSLVTALETIRQDVSTLIQGKICNISALNIDPIHLLRILAAEKVSLEFALPDFLRQLHACARHCPSTQISLQEEYLRSAHLTNQDFVLRHYFTQQNYNQQLKQQYNF